MKALWMLALVCVGGVAQATPDHHCAPAARAQAKKLLELHIGHDDRIEIDAPVKQLAPIRNPANKQQSFDVLEVWGFVNKGQYRMRFIYVQSSDQCLLMGEEILEHAGL